MRINCDRTEIKRRWHRRWHRKFVFWPRRIRLGTCVWLGFVERRRVGKHGYYEYGGPFPHIPFVQTPPRSGVGSTYYDWWEYRECQSS